MMHRLLAAAVATAAGAALAAGVGAQTAPATQSAPGGQGADDLSKYIISDANAPMSVYGPNQTVKLIKDDKVQGGRALRVTVKVKGPEPYSVGAALPLNKAIKKGDQLLIAFWARAPQLADGAKTPIPFYGVAQSVAPYAAVASGSAELTNSWVFHQVRGVASQDLPVGTGQLSIQLSAEKAVIDLGPAVVLDLGPKA